MKRAFAEAALVVAVAAVAFAVGRAHPPGAPSELSPVAGKVVVDPDGT